MSRTSGMLLSGAAPFSVNAKRASAVISIAVSIAESSTRGRTTRPPPRPMSVLASSPRSPRTASHSMPRPQIRPASIRRLWSAPRSGSGARVTGSAGARVGVALVLIGEPLAPLGLLASRQRFALALHAGLLVVLTLLEFGQEPGLLTLLLEALERALEGFVGLDDDFGHSAPSLRDPGGPLAKRQLYTTRQCPPLAQLGGGFALFRRSALARGPPVGRSPRIRTPPPRAALDVRGSL